MVWHHTTKHNLDVLWHCTTRHTQNVVWHCTTMHNLSNKCTFFLFGTGSLWNCRNILWCSDINQDCQKFSKPWKWEKLRFNWSKECLHISKHKTLQVAIYTSCSTLQLLSWAAYEEHNNVVHVHKVANLDLPICGNPDLSICTHTSTRVYFFLQ